VGECRVFEQGIYRYSFGRVNSNVHRMLVEDHSRVCFAGYVLPGM
jgi:hypothetical protein